MLIANFDPTTERKAFLLPIIQRVIPFGWSIPLSALLIAQLSFESWGANHLSMIHCLSLFCVRALMRERPCQSAPS